MRSLWQRSEPVKDPAEAIAAYAGERESATSLVGASAKQLFETAVHSLDTFEPRAPASFDEEHVFDSFDDGKDGAQAGTQAVVSKANYEVGRPAPHPRQLPACQRGLAGLPRAAPGAGWRRAGPD